MASRQTNENDTAGACRISILAMIGLWLAGCAAQEQVKKEAEKPRPASAARAGDGRQPGRPAHACSASCPTGPACRSTPGPRLPMKQHSFTSEGADFDVDVSPDGQRMVFASTRHSAQPDLYIKTRRRRGGDPDHLRSRGRRAALFQPGRQDASFSPAIARATGTSG